MSEKYKFTVQDGLYFVTPTIVEWIDLFTKKQYCDIVLESLKFCQQNKGLRIHAWCIMSSHLHLIISSKNGNLSGIMRDFKTYTNQEFVKDLSEGKDSRRKWIIELFKNRADEIKRIKNYKVWQDGNHPVLLDTNKIIDDRLQYTHQNPVVQGLVYNAEDYLYSSAIDYCGGKGLLEIELIY